MSLHCLLGLHTRIRVGIRAQCYCYWQGILVHWLTDNNYNIVDLWFAVRMTERRQSPWFYIHICLISWRQLCWGRWNRSTNCFVFWNLVQKGNILWYEGQKGIESITQITLYVLLNTLKISGRLEFSSHNSRGSYGIHESLGKKIHLNV